MAHDRPPFTVLSSAPAAPDTAELEEREFWVSVRRSFLGLIDAIEKRHGIPSVIEQHERRKSAQKP